MAGSRAPLKAALLDQKRIAGLGNIYVCEALFRAGLNPSRPAGVLANARGGPTRAAVALAKAIREVLEEAIEAGRLDSCATIVKRTATSAIFSTPSRSTIAKARLA